MAPKSESSKSEVNKFETNPVTDKAKAERGKALDTALAQIERQYGKGSVMRMGDRRGVITEVIPTGSIALDLALGIGGLPRGRVVEITDLNQAVKQLLHYMQLQMLKKLAESRPSSMQNMHLIQSMQNVLV